MIASLGVLTAADQQTWCLANGSTAADCAAVIASQTVNGVFCDGDVVLSLDANGNHVSSCIPSGQIEAQIAAIKADCLAHCGQSRTPALDAECVPYCPQPVPASSGLLVLGGLAALAAFAVWHLTR